MTDVEDATRLWNLAESILETVNAVFEQAGHVLPSRQYILLGEPAHDCEQVTVSFQQMYLGGPGAQAQAPQKCNDPQSAYFQVEIVRAVPVGSARKSLGPEADALNSSAKVKLIDSMLLLDVASALPASAFFGVLADVAPQESAAGEMQAVILNLTVGIP